MAVYRLPFSNANNNWGGLTHTGGNWDDPTASKHAIGQPYGWDIGFVAPPGDSGGNINGKIYAARSGTVVDFRNTITSTGSNAGNYVLIRHADNTLMAYNHLKYNSVQVTDGDYVEQGTWLAVVGQTGSASNVHVHLEGRAWWVTGTIGTEAGYGGTSLLTHFRDNGHNEPYRPTGDDTFATNPLQYRQDGWRFCYQCAALFFSYQGSNGVCPNAATSGGPHASNGGNYTLSDDANADGEANWKFCSKCRVLFFAGVSGSKCPVITPNDSHNGTGSGNYHIIMNVPGDPGQHGWRYCSKCKGMCFGTAATSVCPDDGNAHLPSPSWDYSLDLSLEDTQQNWRRCSKCRSLFFPASGSTTSGGVCPDDGLAHTAVSSKNYTLCIDVSPINADSPQQNSVPASSEGWQAGWRFCNKCHVLFFGANQASSDCPYDDGNHSSTGSGNYYLTISNRNDTTASTGTISDDVGGLGEIGWRWCNKCQCLWLSGSGSTCPQDNGTHSTTNSGNYILCVDSLN